MHEARIPANARGVVARSSFWATGDRDGERWRRGWWDAFDRKAPPQRPDEAYALGRKEYLDHFAPDRAGRNESMKIIERPIGDLREHPLNTRKKSVETVAEMRASIERHGLLQPLVVKPDGTILAGHRRFWGASALGLKSLPCFEADGESEAKALEILLVANDSIEPPDPLKEAAAVAALLGTAGWTVKTVADTLGRSVHWVARRARLRDLTDAVRAAVADEKHPLSTWPAQWLEELAVLAPEAQDRVLKVRDRLGWIRDVQDLHRLLRDDVHVLGVAPFDLMDSRLVPKAGACDVCPKTSFKRPGLFEDDEQVDGRDLAKARCLDGKCWGAKVNACVAAGIAAAKKEEPGLRVVASAEASTLKALQDVNAVRDYQVTVCAPSAKGAKPIAFVSPDGKVEVKHAQFGTQAATAARASKPKEKKTELPILERLAASKKDIAQRRGDFVVDELREAVMDPKTLAPAIDVVRTLLVFDAAQERAFVDANAKVLAKMARTAADDAAFARAVWAGLKGRVVDTMLESPTNQSIGEVARWFAQKFGVSLADLERKAAEEIPDPKWWPRTGDPTPAQASKLKGRTSESVAPVRTGAGGKVDAALRRAGIKVDAALRRAGIKDPKLVAPAAKAAKKRKKNSWVSLSPAERLERVNQIRKGKGLPAKDAL